MRYVRPSWIAGHRSEPSDEALLLTEAALMYSRGVSRSDEASEELLKRMNECRAEIHYRAATHAPRNTWEDLL